MAENKSRTKTKPASTSGSKGVARAKRKTATRAKAGKRSKSDLHYVLIAKDGTLTVLSRETGLATGIESTDVKAFSDIIAARQALGKKLGKILVARDLNGGSWEDCIFIESYK
jgi:hypothetical protein